MTAPKPRNRSERRAAAKRTTDVPEAGTLALAGGHPDFPMEVTLTGTRGSWKMPLTIPKSMGLRYEVTYAWAESQARAGAAALGLCSVSLRTKVPYRHQGVHAYGLAVIDYLLSEGVGYPEILAAGRLAWLHLSHDLLDGQEVKEQEVFSKAPTEPSTAS